jgi:TonB family protein
MSEKQIGVLSSILLHILILAIALIVKYTIITETQTGRIEILEFGYKQPSRNEGISSFPNLASAKATNTGRKTNIIPKRIDLPKAVSTDDEPIYVPKSRDTAINDLDVNDKIGTSSNIKSNLSDKISGTIEDDAELPETEGFLASLSDRLSEGSGDGSSYVLEGDVSTRVLIYKEMPKYPEDIQQSANIKIKFDVLRTGEITKLMIVKKGAPAFENACLNALKKWKFNTISGDIVQTGYITFIFDLE